VWQRIQAPSHRLVGSAFVMDMANGCAMLAVQFTGVALGAGPAVLGLLGAVGGAAYIISCLGSGMVADRFGPRRTTRLAAALMIVVWLAIAQAGRIELLLGLAMASGAIMALFWPSLMVWVADLSSGQARGLGRTLGMFNVSWTSGLLGGFVIAGALWDWVGQASLYCSVAAGLLILVLLQVTPGGASRGGEHPPDQPTALARPALGRRLRIAGRVGVFASFFCTAMVRALFPKVGEALGYSSALVGWAVGVPYLSAMVVFALTVTTGRWQYRSRKLWLAVPAGVVGMVLATSAQEPWQFLLGFSLVGVCGGISFVSSQFYGLHQPEHRRIASMRHHEVAVGAGQVAGPLLGGLVAGHYGQLPAAFALAAGVMIIAGLAQIVLWSVMSKADEASAA